MGIDAFDPLIQNVYLLSELESVENAEKEYIAGPFSLRLFARSSFLGRVCSILTYIGEWLGWISSHENFSTVLKTTQVALETFKDYLSAPSEEPSGVDAKFVSLSFDEKWQSRLRHVSFLLTEDSSFPSFEKAQRIASPIILKDITRTPDIPWELFSMLMNKKELDGPSEQQLKEWIRDIEIWGTFISPFLLLCVFKEAACRTFPQESPEKQVSYAFFLSWRLYQAGFRQLTSTDITTEEVSSGVIEVDGQDIPVRFSEPISLTFPLDAPISAYTLEGCSDLMGFTSKDPLLLGMWVHNVYECPSVIPCVHPVSCDPRGKYIIVERVTHSLEGDIWQEDARDLMENIAGLCRTLLSLPSTLDIDVDSLFLTTHKEIRTLSPLTTRYPFFCLELVEQFIRRLCHDDQSLLKDLFERISLWQHPAVLMHRSLIQNFSFSATDPDIHRELEVFNLDDRCFPYVADWVRLLRREVNLVSKELKTCESFSLLPKARQTRVLVGTILALQREMGWISSIPQDLVPITAKYIQTQVTKEPQGGIILSSLSE